ncbi:MAG: hypothetical protein LBM98_04785 [Oscillospiraceae bacterium]|jgi:hypothetical protein|nr:hypothetical protein [Oscillospiraceae bacterium]
MSDILPKLDKIRIPVEKFTEYALNPYKSKKSKDKATAFELALGYNLGNYELLINSIAANIPYYKAVAKGDNGYGMTYEVIMPLKGDNGKTAKVLTAWIDDLELDEMRLINAYVDK